jgi:hypothetical protein
MLRFFSGSHARSVLSAILVKGGEMPETITYRAFLSYSHQDSDAGSRIHKAVENYRVPQDLVGHAGAFGPIPSGRLRPVFRDRFDLAAGHSLNNEIEAALKVSDALIVLCSPHSAKSPYVNEEIRRFKLLGKSERIYPIIVDGEPGDPARECFPANLRHEFDDEGRSTAQITEPIAADLREKRDGPELATLKLIAGLLGVPLDELRKREVIEQRRRQRRLIAVATLMTVLAVAAVGFAGYSGVLTERLSKSLETEKQARRQADDRYNQSLKSTLRLIAVSATFRSLWKQTDFQTMVINEKSSNGDFSEFLGQGAPNNVWARFVDTLMDFQRTLPHELMDYRSQIVGQNLPRQWVEHAERIMSGLVQTDPHDLSYQRRLREIDQMLDSMGARRTAQTAHCDHDPRHAEVERQNFETQLRNSPTVQLGPPLPPCP